MITPTLWLRDELILNYIFRVFHQPHTEKSRCIFHFRIIGAKTAPKDSSLLLDASNKVVRQTRFALALFFLGKEMP